MLLDSDRPFLHTCVCVSGDDAVEGALRAAKVRDDMRVVRARTGVEGLRELASRPADVVLVDLEIDDVAPRDLVSTLANRYPGLPVLVVATPARVAEAVDFVRRGAADYLRKPLHSAELALALEGVARAIAADDAPPPLRASDANDLVGRSPTFLEVLRLADRAAKSQATVLVRGETGTGKELVARRIHERSPRAAEPFIKVHCAALPDQLLESELFGYEKGAFTGAQTQKPGRVDLAEGGTLFLDEIGDITAATQVKLLRVLQDRKYERLGGSKTIDADVRFVTASHRNIEEMVARGQFREDLYYRINVVSITMPPLRQRADDVPELARHFAALACREHGRHPVDFTEAALSHLGKHRWPGNVRQLQNVVERLVVMTDDAVIGESEVLEELGPVGVGPKGAEPLPEPSMSLEGSVALLGDAVRKAERKALEKALRKAGGNRTTAARILGISRRTLYYKLEEHGLAE
jgi:two-component system response regulator AtoC